MRVALGSDHAGYEQKQHIMQYLADKGAEVIDLGAVSAVESVDYPDFALKVGHAVASGQADLGVLVCGTGVGMAIAANKVQGVRAANVTDPEFARLARAHNNANVLALSGRLVSIEMNERIIDAFLDTAFEGGRHERRVDKIDDADRDECCQ
jgi:ribose 5-phosphate isomerase B